MNQLQELYQKFKGLMLNELTPRSLDNTWRIIREDLEVASTLRSGATTLDQWLEKVEDIANKLKKGMPVQYVTGRSIFYGLELIVNEQVLIPRPETEELVHWILETLEEDDRFSKRISALEVGVGSGCISLALRSENDLFQMTGVDISPEALKVARLNADRLGLPLVLNEMNFLEKSSWDSLSTYDILVSNPPYITTDEMSMMESNVLDYEPSIALFVEDDPLVFYKAILDFSKDHLNAGGYVFAESNEFYTDEVKALWEAGGLKEVVVKKDMQYKPRMIRARI